MLLRFGVTTTLALGMPAHVLEAVVFEGEDVRIQVFFDNGKGWFVDMGCVGLI